jgi:hypothetical protein
MALQRDQTVTILLPAVVTAGEASLDLATFEVLCLSPCTTCFVLLVIGVSPEFRDFSS